MQYSLAVVSVPISATVIGAYLERTQQALIHAHHSSCIVKFPAIVGCTEQRDQLALREELVSVLNDLMGTADKVHIVFLQEARYDVRAEGEGDTAVVFAPSSDVFVGIGPQQIAEKTAVGNL